MERRRVAVVLAGLVLVGGAVAVLRTVNAPPEVTGDSAPPLPTALKAFAAPGVVIPSAGAHPGAPGRLSFAPGDHRLWISWPPVAGAAGYQVSWDGRDELVAEPDVELNGLVNGADTPVQVRAVDDFGQRSAPASGSGRARADGTRYTLADRFDGPSAPDPRLWRLTAPNSCAAAGHGPGPDADRLLITGNCANGSVELRARTPFTLRAAPADGVLGRFVVATDAPGEDGELDLDLVPGPVDLVGSATGAQPDRVPAGQAGVDPGLPPGTIRVRIVGDAGSGPAPVTRVDVLTGAGVPQAGVPGTAGLSAPAAPRTGRTERWEVDLRTDGLRVSCDGREVDNANIRPGWTSATALVGVTAGDAGRVHTGISLIALDGARATTPALVAPPVVRAGRAVDAPGSTPPGSGGRPIGGVDGGTLRLSLVPQAGAPGQQVGALPPLTAVVAGQRFPLTPAIPGSPVLAGARLPVVARLPAAVLRTDGPGGSLPVSVLSSPPTNGTALRIESAELELDPAPGSRPPAPPTPPAVKPLFGAALATPTASLADAAGVPEQPGQPLPRGRAVLTVRLDAPETQRANGALTGLAGIEVWLDGVNTATVPTAVDGPGIGGTWQIAFTDAALDPGTHTVEVRGFTTTRGGQYVETFASFTLGPQ